MCCPALGALTQLVWARGQYLISNGFRVLMTRANIALGLPLERPKCTYPMKIAGAMGTDQCVFYLSAYSMDALEKLIKK
jgi:hypothetical protein